MTLIFVVILMALVFEYINGFHDTANSIATVVATRVLTARQAVVMAACTNSDRRDVGHGRGVDHRVRAGRPEDRFARSVDLRARGRDRLEPHHVEGWAAKQFESCAGGRPGGGGGCGRTKLERCHLVASPIHRTGIRAKDCCGKSSFRCSHRHWPAS